MKTRRQIIKECYQRQLELHGGEIISHLCVRKYVIRPALLAAGQSLLPLKFTSLRYPKPFDLYMKAYRLKHRTMQVVDYDEKMRTMATEREAEYRKGFRRTRMQMLRLPIARWEPEDKGMTFLALCKGRAGVTGPDDPLYEAIKERWLSSNITHREAIERTLSELDRPV